VRAHVKNDFDRVFRHLRAHLLCPASSRANLSSAESDGVDVLLHPSAIRTAPRLPLPDQLDGDRGSGDGEGPARGVSSAGVDEYLQDVMAVPASLAGLPALSVPAGLGEDGWPVGVSVVGQWGMDELVLQVGRAVEGVR